MSQSGCPKTISPVFFMCFLIRWTNLQIDDLHTIASSSSLAFSCYSLEILGEKTNDAYSSSTRTKDWPVSVYAHLHNAWKGFWRVGAGGLRWAVTWSSFWRCKSEMKLERKKRSISKDSKYFLKGEDLIFHFSLRPNVFSRDFMLKQGVHSEKRKHGRNVFKMIASYNYSSCFFSVVKKISLEGREMTGELFGLDFPTIIFCRKSQICSCGWSSGTITSWKVGLSRLIMRRSCWRVRCEGTKLYGMLILSLNFCLTFAPCQWILCVQYDIRGLCVEGVITLKSHLLRECGLCDDAVEWSRWRIWGTRPSSKSCQPYDPSYLRA